MSTRNDIQFAQEFACRVHDGQTYGDKPYRYHLNSVVANVAELYSLDPDYRDLCVIAWLHDVLEDTGVAFSCIQSLFGSCVADAVMSMTRSDEETYGEYIARLCANKLAVKVKLADAMANFQQSTKERNYKRMEKYSGVVHTLSRHLSKEEA